METCKTLDDVEKEFLIYLRSLTNEKLVEETRLVRDKLNAEREVASDREYVAYLEYMLSLCYDALNERDK